MQKLKMQAEESEKLKTAFINSICHEIRTPLNGIAGFAQLLTDSTTDPDERESFCDEILTNTDQLVTLINSMLEVANLDVSDEKLPCTPVDLIQLCHHVHQVYAKENHNSNVSIVAQLPAGELIVETNQHYLTMVLNNLMTNACKFTETGSIILGCRVVDKKVEIAISDTGCGIPEANREQVFERFTKLNIYTQGTGLGLYMSKIITRRLSGSISIDPGYTDGTRMVVILPLK